MQVSVKNSGAGAGSYRQGDGYGRRWVCVWSRGCAGELDNIIISALHSAVWWAESCIMYLDNIIIDVRNVSKERV
jgi:hypothetical protein